MTPKKGIVHTEQPVAGYQPAARIATRGPRRSTPRLTLRRRIAHRRELPRVQVILYGIAGVLVLGLLWQVADWQGWSNPIIWSSPSRVWTSFRQSVSNGQLGPAVASTARLFGVGFGISVVVGVGLGVVVGWYPRVKAALDPVLSLAYALPRIALIPIVVAALGPTFSAQVVIVVLLGAFPILINVASGIATVSGEHLRLARSFLATSTDVLRSIALPGAVPAIISGLRQGMNLSLAGVVVAEYFVGATGVGGLIFKAGETLNTGLAIVGALVFAFGALVMTIILQVAERRFDRWRVS
jgi:ABC-type nitrate/sulfonate/bicarbonate transport system permease component